MRVCYNIRVLGVLAQLVERYTGSVEVSGSNPLCSTSPNLKRTPFVRTVLGFFFTFLGLFCAVLSRQRAVIGCCHIFRRFMPRKPLDVRKERVRLLLPKANQNPTDIIQSGCCVSPLFASIHVPERLASSGTWNK